MFKKKEVKDKNQVNEKIEGGIDEVTEGKDAKNEQTKPDLPPVPALKLFQFASTTDKLLMVIASICSILNGISQPLLFLVFSSVLGLFSDFQKNSLIDAEFAAKELQDAVNWLCVLFVIIGSVTAVAAYFQLSLWLIIGERQAVRIRNLYYRSVLSQNMGWFDSVQSGDIATRIAGDVNQVQDGISDKIGLLIQYLSTVIGGFVIAFINGWKLTLVLLSVVPILAGCGMFFGKMISEGAQGGSGAYGAAGSIAEEVLSAIRTVYSFNAQSKEQARYESKLVLARKEGLKKAVLSGLSMGIVMLILFGSYALAMWFGGRLILEKENDPKQVLTVFFNVLIGAMTLGQTSPSITALATAQGAAAKLFQVIENVSLINPFEITPHMVAEEKKITPINGSIEFKNIEFSYPSRPDIPILKNISLTIEPGTSVALVGPSGSGKSTTVGLIERFYDPLAGQILLDGLDIKTISTKYLRENIGIVGQEPVLFATTIKANILFGLKNDSELESDPAELQKRVEDACKLANIHKFIMTLPKRYETMVGDKGSQLSGGQKQRIAIARAIIKNPKILLLDEATSALDTESEKVVQQALDKASENRTTIIIAHRLSTIKQANKIVVFDRGTIIEQGNHDQLLNNQGIYAELVKAQSLRTEEKQLVLKGSNEDLTAKNTPDHVSLNMELVEEESEEDYGNDGILKIATKAESINDPKKLADLRRQKEPLPMLRVLSMCKQWWPLFLLGTFGALLEGATFPVYSIILTRATQAFFTLDAGFLEEGQKDINFWALMFVVLGIACFVACFLRLGGFASVGEYLTYDVRRLCFKQLLNQEVAYYDDPNNSIGIVTAKLSTEAEHMQGLLSKVLGAIFIAISCAIVGLAIAFASGWKLTLVALACLPLTAFGQLMEMNALTDINKETKKAYLKVSQIAMESITNIRTLSSLTREELFYQDYLLRVDKAHKLANKGFFKAAAGYGVAMGSPLFVNALVFWYGTTLVASSEYSYVDMFQVITAVMFTGMSLGFVSAELTSLVKSKVAAIEVFELLDRKPEIDATPDFGYKQGAILGNVEGKNAHFAYPSRKDVPVLRGLDISVIQNKKVALVGASGSGKSTIFALLQRFYNLEKGEFDVESKNLEQWNVPYLRSALSMVGQEPVLFDMTVAENIAYGAEEPVTQQQIEQCAKMANAHDFITQLSEGYDTRVGERGGKLSGGQKQRVAIARALIRNPKILMLDEATSALDSQSEHIVQQALDNASANRTTITIAHRLSTVQDSDLIIVFREGKKVEMGTHDQLLALKGYYYSLVNQQNLSANNQS